MMQEVWAVLRPRIHQIALFKSEFTATEAAKSMREWYPNNDIKGPMKISLPVEILPDDFIKEKSNG